VARRNSPVSGQSIKEQGLSHQRDLRFLTAGGEKSFRTIIPNHGANWRAHWGAFSILSQAKTLEFHGGQIIGESQTLSLIRAARERDDLHTPLTLEAAREEWRGRKR
jgi:hypothetical protein